tara:strand:+ start:86 stop:415 length:330 start_codon:yes stop_codon:yes gene_type:complete
MLIKEVITEAYKDDLISAVSDLLALSMSKNLKKISTEKFQTALAKQGFVASIDEIIQAVDQSGFASSVDSTDIVPASELGKDVNTEVDPSVDVSKLAGDQAMSDIKAEL